MKKKVSSGKAAIRAVMAALCIMAIGLLASGCQDPNNTDPNNTDPNTTDPDPGNSGISWTSEANGTLTVINNTGKDMVIFQGQTPSASNILGGVRATSTRVFDVSDDVDDFGIGGYLILRGITLDEYNANKTTLSRARIDYSAMATYKEGKKFRTEISPSYIGDYGYTVTNLGQIGMELRKNSPDGEKIGYLPSLATNVLLYSENSNGLAIFPVYVYYTKSSGQITTVRPTSHFESVTAMPRPLANATSIQSYTFPNDPTVTWETIKASLVSPMAYISVTNNVNNQGAYFTIAGGNSLYAQNGYDGVGTGEQLTFELESTAAGAEKNLVIKLYNGSIMVPVRFAGATGNPTIKNGYDYTVTLNHLGGAVNNVNNYSAVITESAQPRDISSDIASL